MAEVLLEFETPVTVGGKTYMARACGDRLSDSVWQGWVEFLPIGAGEPVRSGRETTQPNREDTVYWATGLTPIFLEGSLRRALNPPTRPAAHDPLPPLFDGPATAARSAPPIGEAILNPFSVHRKGEGLLRRQLSALSTRHLVNIVAAHQLSDRDPSQLAEADHPFLVELIVEGVKERVAR